jgi:aldose 1-epimerase
MVCSMVVSPTSVEPFGTRSDGTPVNRWRLDDGTLALAVLDLGAVIQTLEVPDRTGRRDDVALGFDDAAGYEQLPQLYFGAVVGRFANRIAGGRFSLDGEEFQVPPNELGNALHGGPGGFHGRIWTVEPVEGHGLRCSLLSPDGDQGFPGALAVEVTYRLLPGAILRVEYRAKTDRPTVLNLTQHTYFALDGLDAGTDGQVLQLPADRYTPTTRPSLIPTGEIAPVEGTPLDLREPVTVGQVVSAVEGGIDHNWVLGDPLPADAPLRPAGSLYAPASGRRIDVSTTEPAIQVFSASAIQGDWIGKGGRPIVPGAGICLETQHFPDSPNWPDFPSTRLDPGGVYASVTEFRFSAQ